MAVTANLSAGQVLNASTVNNYMINSGLVYVTQVTVGIAVSSVNITSCFSSTYDNYLISMSNITSSTGGGVLLFKLMVGSTPQTNGWYGNTFYVANGGAGGMSNAPYTNTASMEAMCTSLNYKNSGVFQLQSPNLPTQTRAQYQNCDDYYFRLGAAQLSNSTQYDGIQFVTASGTITGGTITVYGYRKA